MALTTYFVGLMFETSFREKQLESKLGTIKRGGYLPLAQDKTKHLILAIFRKMTDEELRGIRYLQIDRHTSPTERLGSKSTLSYVEWEMRNGQFVRISKAVGIARQLELMAEINAFLAERLFAEA